MKIRYLKFLVSCLTLGLFAALILGTAACSSNPTTTATLSSITIAPALPSPLPVGIPQVFIASGTYSDGRSGVDLSSQVTWTSSDPTIATISSTGLATAVAVGSTNITASLSGITSQTVTLTVVAAIPAPTTTTSTSTATTTGTTTGTTTTTTTTTTP